MTGLIDLMVTEMFKECTSDDLLILRNKIYLELDDRDYIWSDEQLKMSQAQLRKIALVRASYCNASFNDRWLCQCQDCCETLSTLPRHILLVGSSAYQKLDQNGILSEIKRLLNMVEESRQPIQRCKLAIKFFRWLYANQWFVEDNERFRDTLYQKIGEFCFEEWPPARLMSKIFMEEFFPKMEHKVKFKKCLLEVRFQVEINNMVKAGKFPWVAQTLVTQSQEYQS